MYLCGLLQNDLHLYEGGRRKKEKIEYNFCYYYLPK